MNEKSIIKQELALLYSNIHMSTRVDIFDENVSFGFVRRNLYRLKSETDWLKFLFQLFSNYNYREYYRNIILFTYIVRFKPFDNEYNFYREALRYLKILKEKIKKKQRSRSFEVGRDLTEKDPIDEAFEEVQEELIHEIYPNDFEYHNLYIKDIDFILLYIYEKLDAASISTNLNLSNKESLEIRLKKYGFYNLRDTILLNASRNNNLLNLILSSKLKYKVAILYHINYINALINMGYNGNRLYKIIAYLINNSKNERDIKGYINNLKGLKGDVYRSYTTEEITDIKKKLEKIGLKKFVLN